MASRKKHFEVIAVRCTPNEVTLSWQNAMQKTRSTAYSALWLRDNSPAHRSATGERRISLTNLPLQPLLKAAELQGSDHICVTWEDGESCDFSSTFFREFERERRISARPTQLPWLKQPATNFVWCAYEPWVECREARANWLHSLARDGMAFLRGVPIEDGGMQSVVAQLGFMRETNEGRVFDVRSVAEPAGVRVHTGDPYREPVPGFQLLHCLTAAGGESLFVDGLAVAERLRIRDPQSFALLSKTPVRFRFQDDAVDFAADRTMIQVDEHEQFRVIHYDDRSIAPLTLRGASLTKYYAAYRQLATVLDDAARCVTYQPQPGDLVILDNTRILQRHTGASVGALQGCYVDADGIYSSLAVLSRKRSSQLDVIEG
jgi:gamma-butyrobetaine dioxygenase